MSFLPIVDRELRVAARRWSTFLARMGVALIALIVLTPLMFFGYLSGGGSSAGAGAFSGLSAYALVLCLLAGVFITADCLSAEKRDGTLGLLFLTDLKGYDVVLGKFAALSLHTIYGLVAVIPALALPLLVGGVTGGEFWRMTLALTNLLFVSLAVGMAVSAVSREGSKALAGTVLLLLLLVVGLPVAQSLAGHMGIPERLQLIGWASPWYPFVLGKAGSYHFNAGKFWGTLGISHLLGWLLLMAAAVMLPRAWQDRDVSIQRTGWWHRTVGSRIARIFRRQRQRVLLESDPVLWLMGDRPILRLLVWVLTGAWAVIVLSACAAMGAEDAMAVVFGGGMVLLFLFALLFTEHTCQFWVEARRAGALESLLCTPISSKVILSSHWASIRRHFLWPMVLAFGIAMFPLGLALATEVVSTSGLDGVLTGLFSAGMVLTIGLVYVVSVFFALGWTGVWLALKLKRPEYASGLTLLFVVLLPYLFCYLGFGAVLVLIFLPMAQLQSNLRDIILKHHSPMYVPRKGVK